MSLIVDMSQVENKLIAPLYLVLNDFVSITLLTQNIHWNVIGSDFFQIHNYTNSLYEDFFDDQDTFAERLRQLNVFVDVNSLKYNMPSISAPFDSKVAIGILIEANKKLIVDLTNLRNTAAQLNDLETQDLAIKELEESAKINWMLKSFNTNLR